MKKILISILLLGVTALYAEPYRNWVISVVSVSTTTATKIPTTPYSGRKEIRIANLSADSLNLYIDTSTTVTSTDWVVRPEDESDAYLSLSLPSGIDVYGLGEASASTATISIRIMEFK